ncbi:universal stress protein [Halorussus salilacus]|uniref:universal stress protein n=1 Tax=Halorussus salilacus TaxID=2953750 RepID=UPI00209EB1D1|nr:universal stress protein [Halorussus salilacus]USZ68166.1 universal stress protein [Halorussus salilacus]
MKYLVAVDGSESSMDALRHAVELAAATGAEVEAATVVVPEQFFAGGDGPPTSLAEADEALVAADIEDAETEAQAVLEEAEAVGDRAGVEVEAGMLYGEPVDELVEYAEGRSPSSSRTQSDDAEREGVDAIFVGHRGLSEEHEGRVGSTAKDIVGRATVPVTVVR